MSPRPVDRRFTTRIKSKTLKKFYSISIEDIFRLQTCITIFYLLQEEVYPANMADLSHSLYVADKGLMLKVSGYSENLHVSETLPLRVDFQFPAARVMKKLSNI